jgi:hypothetical protein
MELQAQGQLIDRDDSPNPASQGGSSQIVVAGGGR